MASTDASLNPSGQGAPVSVTVSPRASEEFTSPGGGAPRAGPLFQPLVAAGGRPGAAVAAAVPRSPPRPVVDRVDGVDGRVDQPMWAGRTVHDHGRSRSVRGIDVSGWRSPRRGRAVRAHGRGGSRPCTEN